MTTDATSPIIRRSDGRVELDLEEVANCALVLVAAVDGRVAWSSIHDRAKVAAFLHSVAEGVEDGRL